MSIVKKFISLILVTAIIISNANMYAFADVIGEESLVAVDGDVRTRSEVEKMAAEELLSANDFVEEEETDENTIVFASDSEVKDYIRDNLLLTNAPDVIDDIEVAENKYVSRDKEIETNEYTLGFKNADGSSTMRVFAFPVKYTDDEGKVFFTDNDNKLIYNPEDADFGTYTIFVCYYVVRAIE